MKPFLFCIACLIVLNIVNANADKQMKQDIPKIVQQNYTM